MDGENPKVTRSTLSRTEEISRRLHLGWRKYESDFVLNKGNIKVIPSQIEKISTLPLTEETLW